MSNLRGIVEGQTYVLLPEEATTNVTRADMPMDLLKAMGEEQHHLLEQRVPGPRCFCAHS